MLGFAALCAAVSFTTGCVSNGTPGSTTTSSALSQIEAQVTPTTLAKAAQDVISAVGAGILQKNPKYSGDVSAAADVFTAIATSNPGALTGADITAALASTNISAANQQTISTYAGSALALYESDFKINFPALKPNYALFATALANGLNVASGNPNKVVALPATTTVTAPATPTPTPTPAS